MPEIKIGCIDSGIRRSGIASKSSQIGLIVQQTEITVVERKPAHRSKETMFTRDAKRVHLPIRIGDVRFGSLANISRGATSALPPKADMCGATRDVCSGPIATFRRVSGRCYSLYCERSPKDESHGCHITSHNSCDHKRCCHTIECCKRESSPRTRVRRTHSLVFDSFSEFWFALLLPLRPLSL